MRIKLVLEIEDDKGEIVERIAQAIEALVKPTTEPAPFSRPENFPPSLRVLRKSNQEKE